MGYNQREGVTLIELIMVIVIVTILSFPGSYLMSFLIQNSVFIPNELNMDMLASDALDIMIEGNDQARGLRFSQVITNITDNQITFINQDSQSIVYRLNANRLERSINAGAFAPIPYYQKAGITVTGKSNRLFTYFDANEVAITPPGTPANVRRIAMTVIAQTGTGSYVDWEGQSEQISSIAVKRFQ